MRELSYGTLRDDLERGGASICSRLARLKPLNHRPCQRFACLVRFAPSATGFHHGQNMAPQEGGDTPAAYLGMDALVDRETLAMEHVGPMPSSIAPAKPVLTISRFAVSLGADARLQSCVLIKINESDSTATTSRAMTACLTQISHEVLGNRTGARGPHWVELCLRLSSFMPDRCMFPMAVIPPTFCVCDALCSQSTSIA